MITHTVDLVLALRDSWSDKLIGRTDFVFRLDGERVFPIKKESGYYAFVNLPKNQFKLEIECKDFRYKTLHIDLEELTDLNFMVELPLIPRFLRSLPLNCSSFFGNADPETKVSVVKEVSRSQLKLTKAKGRLLEINNPAKLGILGAVLAIFDPAQTDFEVFHVVKRYSYEEYLIDHELDSKFKKDDLITKAYVDVADQEGRFNVFVNCQNEAKDYILKAQKGGKLIVKKVKLTKQSEPILLD